MSYRHISNLYANKDILMFKECYATEKIHGCLHPDSKVMTNRGEVRIQEIKIGDMVVSFNEDLGVFKEKKVLMTIVQYPAGVWVKIILPDDKTLIVTEDHRILTRNRGWVEAKNLTKDDDLISY